MECISSARCCIRFFSERGSSDGGGALGIQGLLERVMGGFPFKMSSSLIGSKMSVRVNAVPSFTSASPLLPPEAV